MNNKFDYKEYLNNYPDLAQAGILTEQNALKHWNNHGIREGRVCIPINIDYQQYLLNYPDLVSAGIDTREKAIEHWVRYGYKEKRVCTPLNFNWEQYLINYPYLISAGIDTSEKALKHYLEHGKKVGKTDKVMKSLMNNLELLKVYKFDKKFRLGNNGDGGYVIGELSGDYDLYISAGICYEESFSRDFIKKYKLNKNNSYGFDGTIKEYPVEYTKDITFVKKNISDINDDNNTNLSFFTEKYENIFLKMDIEGGEYKWLLVLDELILNKFKQIAIEFHGITNDDWGCKYTDKMKCLEKLTKTHYLIHAHGNNCGPVINNIPDVIELTFINKNYFDFIPQLNTHPLPILNLDFPNDCPVDINLNFYPFCRTVF
jgi:hypothetical protein